MAVNDAPESWSAGQANGQDARIQNGVPIMRALQTLVRGFFGPHIEKRLKLGGSEKIARLTLVLKCHYYNTYGFEDG